MSNEIEFNGNSPNLKIVVLNTVDDDFQNFAHAQCTSILDLSINQYGSLIFDTNNFVKKNIRK